MKGVETLMVSTSFHVVLLNRGCGRLRDLYVIRLVETADADGPVYRAADADRYAALHLYLLRGDRRRPAGVGRRLERLGGKLKERGGTSFVDREIDADGAGAFHLFETNQV